MMKRRFVLLVAGLSFLAPSSAFAAEVHPLVHPLFSDGAVLQREAKVPVWGWAAPGESVTVEFAGQKQSATAGADGKWMVKLSPMKASAEPRVMTVSGSTADHMAHATNVVVGDVWLCSGQSNMEMGIGACNVPDEIAAADFPMIRLLTVQKKVAYEAVDLFSGSWAPCSPATVAANGWGGFSAAGYFFGRELHNSLKIPIGLIHSSWGGTICEAWASAEGLAPLADFNDRVAGVHAVAAQNRKGAPVGDSIEGWYVKNDPGTQAGFLMTDADDSSWKTMDLPKVWEDAGLPAYDGLVWFRRTFDAPADWAGKELTLSLGPIDDIDTTFVNGRRVGSKEIWNQDRQYKIPRGVVKAGRNVIAIRVLDTAGGCGINGQPAQMHVAPADNAQSSVSLAGAWKYKDTAPIGKVVGSPAATMNNNPNVSTVLFNGMIAPLLPFPIKGAIWYQGESNGTRGHQYRSLLPAMIADWRAHFGVGDFPFCIVSLANFTQPPTEPAENDWAELREAQMLTARNGRNVGLAIAIDIGDAADIHPRNKKEVGRRLALSARALAYGQKIEFSGPWYKSMSVEEGRVRLTFDHVGGGLVVKGDKLTGFAIAGEDRRFVWADAVIEGSTMVVSSPGVAKPVAVRYAWSANPVCNLYNQEGLPAVPFRTDDFPLKSMNNK